ncbi:MAG: hypothetical protein HKP58_07885, partial [Desulfatitalea sp.]|nr:hypothetical protein [Desulfatitalea sp.]NNK00320.1 hypothetical protein [Desulfatitalea sp.]
MRFTLKKANRAVRWTIGCAVGLMALLFALHSLLPLVLSSQRIKPRFLSVLEQHVPGQIDFDRLRVTLLPMPGVTVGGVNWHLPGRFDLKAADASVYVDVWPLIKGRVRIDRVLVHSPAITVERVESSQKDLKRFTWPPDDAALRTMHAVLAELPAVAHLLLKNGSVQLVGPDGKISLAEDMTVEMATSAQRIQLTVTGQTADRGRIEAAAEMDPNTLDGRARIDWTRISIDHWALLLGNSEDLVSIRSTMALHLQLQSHGFQTFQCDFEASAPEMVLARGAGQTEIKAFATAGTATLTAEQYEVTIHRLTADAPRLNADMTFMQHFTKPVASDAIQLFANAKNCDVTRLRAALIALVAEAGELNLLKIIEGGELVQMTLWTTGPDWQHLFHQSRLKVTGTAQGALIRIPGPGPGLNLIDVAGQWQLAGGVLWVRQA